MFGKRQPEIAVREKRRSKRENVNAPAIVQTPASRLQATIVNISASGARLVTSDQPPPRQDVQVIVNGLYLFGRIAWRRDKAFGVRFDEDYHNYAPAQIYQAVEEASEPVYEFDRDAILSSLVNREPNVCTGEANADPG